MVSVTFVHIMHNLKHFQPGILLFLLNSGFLIRIELTVSYHLTLNRFDSIFFVISAIFKADKKFQY
jgi:hypothetical protein